MNIEDLRRVYREFSEFIRRKPNVLRWGIGYKEVGGVPSDTLAFIVTVSLREASADQRIPDQFQGVPVEVVEGEPIEPYANDGIFRPAPGGVAISNQGSFGRGTLGCYLRCEAYPNNLFLLTNNHVIAVANAGTAGDIITQGDNSQFATLFRYPMLAPRTDVDCAVGRMVNGGADATSPEAMIGILDAIGQHIGVSAEIGTIGATTAACALTAGLLNTASDVPDLVLVYVDAPAGANKAYVSVGRRFTAAEIVAGGWTSPKPINEWIGDETQAVGAAIADVNGDGKPDLILFWIDNRSGANAAFYRIGWSIDQDANIAQWSAPIQIGGWWGSETAGGGIAVGELDTPGRIDLVVMFVDNPGGANMGYVRVGTGLDVTGHASWEENPQPLGGEWGHETQGADITFLGSDPHESAVSFVVAQIDNPGGENLLLQRKVNLSPTGRVVSVGPARMVGGWVGAENAGLGAVVVPGSAGRRLAVATIDNPPGGNTVTLRVANALIGPHFGRWWARPRTETRTPQLGQFVWKSGATTELWAGGKVTQVDVTSTVAYNAPAGNVELRNLFEIKPRISDKGDSGSIVFDDKGYPIGMILGGTIRKSTACGIDNVLRSLQSSSPYVVPDSISEQTRGVGIAAVAWGGAPPRTDLVIADADDGGRIRYRVGSTVDVNGQVRQGWTNPTGIMGTPGVRNTYDIGLAVAQFPGAATPALVLLEVGSDNPGSTSARLRIGSGFNQAGQVTTWSPAIQIPWAGVDCQGADVAVGLIGSFGVDIALLTVFNDGGRNVAKFRVGLNFTERGDADWGDWVEIPGWFGTRTQGAGIVIADIDGTGRGDLVVFFVDDSSGENVGYIQVGKARSTGPGWEWGLPQAISKWWGEQTQGAGLAVADLTGNARPDLLAAHADNPPGLNRLHYRVVYDIMPSGLPAGWAIR